MLSGKVTPTSRQHIARDRTIGLAADIRQLVGGNKSNRALAEVAWTEILADFSHLLCGQPGLRERIGDFAFGDRLLDRLFAVGGLVVADQRRGRALDPDHTPLE
jgi:hypothetical protein